MPYLEYHNIFGPHSGIGEKMPAEELGAVLKGPDKWLTTIRHAALPGA